MNNESSKSKPQSHKPSRIAAFASAAIILVIALFFLFHSEKTTLTIPADLDRETIDLTLRAYSAEKLAEPLYTYDATATISNGKLSFTWQIPDEFTQRDALIELTTREKLDEDESYYNSCAYFVPAHSRGVVPDLFNWNDLTESQQVGCSEATAADEKSSYISMMSDVQQYLNSLTPDSGITMLGDTSTSIAEIRDIVNEIWRTGGYSTVGIVGPQGIAGTQGAQGDQGEKGDAGTNGVASVADGLVLNNYTLSLKTCAAGQVLKTINNVWQCATDDNSGTGGASLPYGTSSGDILSWDTTANTWIVSPAPVDTDTVHAAGFGLKLDTSNAFHIDALPCAAGQYLTWDGTNFSCATDQNTPDTDTDTTYGAKANGGLVLDANNDFSLMTCADTQILKWVGANNRWECAADDDTVANLSGYLQIANLQTEIDNLTPGYYTKTEVNSLLTTMFSTIPAGGLKVPQEIPLESSLGVSSCTEAGDHFYIQDMDVTHPGHTGRAWCYEDSTGTMQLYKIYDNYLSIDNSSIITSSGIISVNTAWLDTYLNGKTYATQTDLATAIAGINFTPYVKYTDIPTCSAGYVLTSTTAGVFSCVSVTTVDNDTTYQAGNGLALNTIAGNNVFSINAPTCTANQYLTWNGASFSCATDQNTPDTDTNTTYTAKTDGGLALNAATNEFSLQVCANDQILAYSTTAAAWQCAQQSASLPNGTAAGEMLYWDGSAWQLTGNSGNQTLDFVTVEDDLAVNGDALVSGELTPVGGIVDAYGRTGAYGEHLVIDINGNLKWELDQSCATVIQPTNAPFTYFPTMTSDTAPAPFTTNGSETFTAGNYRAYYAFDNDLSTNWNNPGPPGKLPATLQIGNSQVAYEVSNYAITSLYNIFNASPAAWTFEGSNDDANWTVLDTQTGIIWTAPSQTQTFNLSTPARYKYYKMVMTANAGYNVSPWLNSLSFAELKLSGTPESPLNTPLLTVKAGDRYQVPAQTVADQVVEDTSGNSYAIGDTIPAGTEVLILTDGTKIGLLDNITTDTGWVRRAEFCGVTTLPGGPGLPTGTRTGQALIWNGTDWIAGEAISVETANTAALNIEDGAASTVFNVDTASGIVSIGNGAVTDSTAVALLLDSSTVAPTNPQNGMMYYDTTLAKFRCYEDGAWKDCITESTPFRDNVLVAGVTNLASTPAAAAVTVPLVANDGDSSLVSGGNTITIPENGYYTVSLDSISYSTPGAQYCEGWFLVNGAITANVSNGSNDARCQYASYTGYFPAGATLQYQIWTGNALVISGQANWSVIRQGNSNLIDRPDLWTPGVEYDFGDGLYGMRATGGGISYAANSRWTGQIMTIPGTGVKRILDSGGSVTYTNNGQITIGQSVADTVGDGAYHITVCGLQGNPNYVQIVIGGKIAITAGGNNGTYDAWIKYTKY